MAKYRAKKGDTLKKLAKKYGVSRKQLRELNPDIKFGKAKKKGGKGFKNIDKDTLLRLGKGVGQPIWKSEILQDPGYAAFDRNFEYNRSKLQDAFLTYRDQQKVDRERAMADFLDQQTKSARNIDTNASQRGMFRSGQRHVSHGRLQNDMDRLRGKFDASQADSLEEARRRKREGIGDLKRKRAEERLSARDRLTMRDAETKYGF